MAVIEVKQGHMAVIEVKQGHIAVNRATYRAI